MRQMSFLKACGSAVFFCLFLTAVIPYPLYCDTNEYKVPENAGIKVEKTTEFLCITSGMLTGTAHIIWSSTGAVDTGTPLYTDILSSVPSLAAGIYTGSMISQWLSDRMNNNYNDPYLIFLFKGILYSSLSGAVILTASIMPLFITSYYTGSIDFNFDAGQGISGLVISSLAGGTGYGLVSGAVFGSIYSHFVYYILNRN